MEYSENIENDNWSFHNYIIDSPKRAFAVIFGWTVDISIIVQYM